MKNFLAISLLAILVVSCVKDDVVEPTDNNTNQLEGSWSLKSVICECPVTVLNAGDDVWTFENSGTNINVFNQVNELYPALRVTGNYAITSTEDSLFIGVVGYEYHYEDDNLIISSMPESDGPYMIFEPYCNVNTADCDNLISGLLEENNELIQPEIDDLCSDLDPNPWIFEDPTGHSTNLVTLVNRINGSCPALTAEIICYACIETWPAMSELNVTFNSSGTTVTKVLDILTPNEDILSYAGVH